MNIDSFYTYLEHPELLNRQSLAELSEINERYPFFQTSRVLFLKNLHLLNDYRYSDELKKVSLYAADRQVLYNLIHDVQINKSIPEEVKNIETKETEEQISVPVDEKKAGKPVIETEVTAEPVVPEVKAGQRTEEVMEEKPAEVSLKIEEPVPVAETKTEIIEKVKAIESEEVISVHDEKIEIIPVVEEVKAEEIKTVPVAEVIILPVDRKPVETEAPKESIADIILRKVAEIKQSRKEPFKEYAYPVIEKKPVSQEIQVTPEPKPEEKIIVSDEIKQAEEVQQGKEESVSNIPEKIDFEVTERIQEIVEPIKDEPLPYVETGNIDNIETEEIKPETVEEIKPEPIPESEPVIPVSEKTEIISETVKTEEAIIQPAEIFEIEKPAFTPPVYDISLLLKDMPEETGPEKPKDISLISMSFSQWLNFMSEEKKPAKKTDQPDLIDTFLARNPKISFRQPEPESKEEDIQGNQNDDYISETLADILMSQGHTVKAIIMFEKLALKYPEKNSYFASRILELKNQNSKQ